MDIKPQVTKPISDDQELAKVLAGVGQVPSDMNYEETPPKDDKKDGEESKPADTPQSNQVAIPVTNNSAPLVAPDDELPKIKKDALIELRPLIEKLNLSPEEKFDIYVMLLRSTDDKTLIAPAYAAAHEIADETKHAQALLDVIREIDYLSTPQPTEETEQK
jgi:hypothetical protein